ncbi:MAG: thymidylate kinase [Pseudomonadota bacterium]
MAMLVAIEGADGAGKNSAATRLCDEFNAAGRRATVIAFPRYGETVAGLTLGKFLAGELPLPVTTEAAAVLYALDRLESAQVIADAAAAHEIVLFDRYTASNMAYQAAKVTGEDASALMHWILRLEREQFALPPADLTIYLDTPWVVARELILRKRQRSYTDRSYDEHEADAQLQLRVRDAYARMADEGLGGRWHVVHSCRDGALRPPADITAEIRAEIDRLFPD